MLKLENVSKYYHSNDTVALGLRRVNLEFNIGEFIAVTGESGSGKSTLLNVISGLDTYEEGELYINGEETSYYSISDWENYRRQYIGFVFQNYNIIDSYSVLENVMIALKLQGYDKETRKERALALIDQVGLSSHVHHKASKLSGGQKQRAVIARALAKDCPIIVCDEPTGNLDSESSANIMNLLAEIAQDKLVIVVTHNYDEVKDYATRRIRLYDGEVIEDKKLKRVVKKDDLVEVAPYKVNIWGLFTLALRNLFRTPRRTIFTTIIFIFIVIVFTFSYGNYVNVINEELGGGFGGVFRNQNEDRITIVKTDRTPFTDSELDQIRDIDDIVYLNVHDLINDTRIAPLLIYDDGYVYEDNFFINPAVTLTKNELKSGRLPDDIDEVVVESNSEWEIGDTVYYNFTSQDLWGLIPQSQIESSTFPLEVVGIAEPRETYYSQTFYMHTDFFELPEMIQLAYMLQGTTRDTELSLSVHDLTAGEFMEGTFYLHGKIIINDTMNDNEISLSENLVFDVKRYIADELGIFMNDVTDQMVYGLDLNMYYKDTFQFSEYDVEIVNIHQNQDAMYETMYMNQNTFDQIFNTNIYQISVHTVDRFDAQSVIEDLEALGYNAIYPTNTQNPMARVAAILLNIVYGFFMVLLMFGTYFIVYVILKNIQISKKKDYLIFRSIGASKSNLNQVTILELMITMLVSFIFVYIILFFQAVYNFIPYIGNLLKYFTIGNYLFLFALLLYLTYILGTRFNRRIFNRSVITALKQE